MKLIEIITDRYEYLRFESTIHNAIEVIKEQFPMEKIKFAYDTEFKILTKQFNHAKPETHELQ